jgi:hypothetical protein
MRLIFCFICISLVVGCQTTKTPQRQLVTLEGYMVVHQPTILLFITPEEQEVRDWGTCHNVAAGPKLIERARRLGSRRVRITAEDIGWPVGDGTPRAYEYTVFRGQRLVPWCILQPYYWAEKIEIARVR